MHSGQSPSYSILICQEGSGPAVLAVLAVLLLARCWFRWRRGKRAEGAARWAKRDAAEHSRCGTAFMAESERWKRCEWCLATVGTVLAGECCRVDVICFMTNCVLSQCEKVFTRCAGRVAGEL
jgi:hypothetical protein